MKHLFLALAFALALGSCAAHDTRTEIVVQRFFGECGAVYGHNTDVDAAETECGILTTLINRFQVENPDIRVRVNVVAWPAIRSFRRRSQRAIRPISSPCTSP